MVQPISRRTFFLLLIASLAAFTLWWFRRLDSGTLVQQFFGFQDDIRKKASGRFSALRRHNATLYQQSVIFFTFTRYRAQGFLPATLRQRVLLDWTNYLFASRDLAWGYIGYPRVGDFQVCNGLIRT